MLSRCSVGVGALPVPIRFGNDPPLPAAAMFVKLGAGASLATLALPLFALITIGAFSFASAFLLGAGAVDSTSSSLTVACGFALVPLAGLSLETFGRSL